MVLLLIATGLMGFFLINRRIDKGVTTIMATLADIQVTLAAVSANMDDVASGVDALEAAIAALKAQVAEGHVITQAELDELAASASAVRAKAETVIADIADTSDQG